MPIKTSVRKTFAYASSLFHPLRILEASHD